MCGIAGVRRYGDLPINRNQVMFLLLKLEHRGNDATGIALQKPDGQVHVLKNDEAAWRFVHGAPFKNFIDEHLGDAIQVILHTRGASQGNPKFNKNNHPMFNGATAVVHNGHIYNDDHLFRELKMDRVADTDSDVIRAILDEEGITRGGIKTLNRMTGSAAIAAISPEYPGKMLLARSGSPLEIASDKNFFYFASEKHAIHRAARPVVLRWNMAFQFQSLDLAYSTMANHTAWILGNEGQELHQEFKSLIGDYREPNRSRVYGDFRSRTERNVTAFKSSGMHRHKCTACGIENLLTADEFRQGLHMFSCNNPRCKRPLK